MNKSTEEVSHFGFQSVNASEKAEKVRQVFTSVADKYDVMNDVMSFGLHRVWKRYLLSISNVKSGDVVLDLAAGTCDLAAKLNAKVGEKGRVVASDINAEMLCRGRDRLLDDGIFHQVQFAQANAELLPFVDHSFNSVFISFGLRNVTHIDRALAEIYRVLKPGGRCYILEFSKVAIPALERIYDQYSFKVIPKFGKLISGDEASYVYLVESIRKHPDQDQLKEMMQAAEFEHCDYLNLSAGIVAIHRGVKY